ncbi:hypothetical protein [Streptomyces sp. NPDC086010]|uniref:hypothetical protein n=1 Tax=Streptomyces sp. NPDC086010 TaxID=3365745 RepID=UPI0037D4536A
MFRHRRVRILTVLLSGWVALTVVERVAEDAPWPSAALGGLLWASLVAAVWWFAEWTQSPLRTAREAAEARRREAAVAYGETVPADGDTDKDTDGGTDPGPGPAGRSHDSPAPARR